MTTYLLLRVFTLPAVLHLYLYIHFELLFYVPLFDFPNCIDYTKHHLVAAAKQAAAALPTPPSSLRCHSFLIYFCSTVTNHNLPPSIELIKRLPPQPYDDDCMSIIGRLKKRTIKTIQFIYYKLLVILTWIRGLTCQSIFPFPFNRRCPGCVQDRVAWQRESRTKLAITLTHQKWRWSQKLLKQTTRPAVYSNGSRVAALPPTIASTVHIAL